MSSSASPNISLAALLPQTFILQPPPGSSVQCPQGWQVLALYAVSSVLVSILSIVLAHRGFIRRITCHLFGQIYDSRPGPLRRARFVVQLLIPLAVEVLATWLVVVLIDAAPGYDDGFPTGLAAANTTLSANATASATTTALTPLATSTSLDSASAFPPQPASPPKWIAFFFLLATRPRFAWILVGNLSSLEFVRSYAVEFPYRTASVGLAIAEVVLQFLGLIAMGVFARFGDLAGYSRVWDPHWAALPQVGKVLYAGVFLYMVMGVLGVVAALPICLEAAEEIFSGQMLVEDEGWTGNGPRGSKMASTELGSFVVMCLFWSWVASWLFWGAYVHIPNAYCPPSLGEQGIIWTVSGALASFFGAGA